MHALIKNGDVVLPSGPVRADVLVQGERIHAIGMDLSASDPAFELDAHGCYVLPGGVDPHVHTGIELGEYATADDFGDCTRAAARGGTTTIVDFAIPARQGDSPLKTFEERRELAASLALIDVNLHATLTRVDADVLEEIPRLAAAGARTFKMFMVYRGLVMVTVEEIYAALEAIAVVDGLALIHAESNHLVEAMTEQVAAGADRSAAAHPKSRPSICEVDAVQAVSNMLELTGARGYIVHVSAPEALDVIEAARARGVRVEAETCPHYLLLDEESYRGADGALFVCSPPLRPRAEAEALRRRLLLGEISFVGSDHCCYTREQKFRHRDDFRLMPNGLPGVETRVPLLFSELVAGQDLPLRRFVELVATQPARVNGLYPRKGAIQPGSDADIVVIDPKAETIINAERSAMATDYSPFEGRRLQGAVRDVVARGELIVADGRLTDTGHRGAFVPSGPIAS